MMKPNTSGKVRHDEVKFANYSADYSPVHTAHFLSPQKPYAADPIWDRERFTPNGSITEEMASRSLTMGANKKRVMDMMDRIQAEQTQVCYLVMEDIESMMRMGAEIAGMTYNSTATFNKERECTKPEHTRISFLQDRSADNIQIIHFIFHELPGQTYEDIMMKRQSHMEYDVCQMGERKMMIRWTMPTLDVTSVHKNCVQRVYNRILNDKKMSVCRAHYGGTHNKYPFVRISKSFKQSGNSVNYKEGEQLFYWKSPTDGMVEVNYHKTGKQSKQECKTNTIHYCLFAC
jgi:hypothetical protein